MVIKLRNKWLAINVMGFKNEQIIHVKLLNVEIKICSETIKKAENTIIAGS